MRRWTRSIFSIVIIRERPANAPSPRKFSCLEKFGLCVFFAGLGILATGGFYDIHAYRSGPPTPDATHTVEETEHGGTHYKTPDEVRTVRILNIVGASFAGPAAALLVICDLFEKRNSARQKGKLRNPNEVKSI
jgi:hypothetical protein